MQPKMEGCGEDDELPKLTLSKHCSSPLISSSSSVEDNDDEDVEGVTRVVNKRKTLLESCLLTSRIDLYMYPT